MRSRKTVRDPLSGVVAYLHATKGWRKGSPPAGMKHLIAIKRAVVTKGVPRLVTTRRNAQGRIV